jgi:hypothetical protein
MREEKSREERGETRKNGHGINERSRIPVLMRMVRVILPLPLLNRYSPISPPGRQQQVPQTS